MSLEVHLLGFAVVAIGFITFTYMWSKRVEQKEEIDGQSDDNISSTESEKYRGDS